MNKDKLAEYIIDRILKGDVFLLGDEDIVQLLERKNDIKFERADIEEFNQPIMIKKYDKESKLYFIRKDDKLKKYSSDLWIPAGANWETLFGFYFEKEIPIKVHIYYIGRKFDLDKLSEMVYSLFTDSEDHIKICNIAFKYDNGVQPNKKLEKAIVEDLEGRQKWKN